METAFSLHKRISELIRIVKFRPNEVYQIKIVFTWGAVSSFNLCEPPQPRVILEGYKPPVIKLNEPESEGWKYGRQVITSFVKEPSEKYLQDRLKEQFKAMAKIAKESLEAEKTAIDTAIDLLENYLK